MARRRRTKYTWLPNTGTAGPAADVEDTSNGRDFGALLVPQNGTTVIAIVDLLQDEPSEEAVTNLPMGVYINNEYFLKRLVGKWFISQDQNNGEVSPAILVAAGVFVARAEDVDSGGPNIPIGALTQAQAVDNYSPLRQEVIREPWVWRRTWVLGQATTPIVTQFPRTTADYGSIQDGPHMDAKTARRISSDERLYACVAARNFPLNVSFGAQNSNLRAYLDYRALGASRRAKGRSAF